MATYNGARFLKEQLQSFVDQQRLPDELVCTDDCSTDETIQVLEEFARTAPFTVHIHKNPTNLGYAQNFNKALMLCHGDLVFLSDQDDVWFAHKIATVAGVAERQPEMLAFMNDAALTDEGLNPAGLSKLQQIRVAGIPMQSFVMGCCSAVRRELLDQCLPVPDGYPAHDDWIINFADALGSRFIIDESLQYYRRHDSNSSDFMANSLSPLPRWTQKKRNLSLLFSKERRQQFEDQLRREEMLAMGLKRAEHRQNGLACPQIQRARRLIDRRVELLRLRRSLQTRALPKRLWLALQLLVQGRYRAASGVKSFIRDVIA
jgi:glycosyltransferase involved in cell wall biosynthesis